MKKSTTTLLVGLLFLLTVFTFLSIYAIPALSKTTQQKQISKPEKRIISGYKVLNPNTEQLQCWTTPELAKKGLKECTSVIHSDARFVKDIDGKWKNFTDVAVMQYNDDGSFNLTFRNWSILIGNSVKIKSIFGFEHEYKHDKLKSLFSSKGVNRKGIVKKMPSAYEWGINLSNIDSKKIKISKVGFEILKKSNIGSVKRRGNCWLINDEVKVCFDDLLRYNYTVEYDSINNRFLVGNVTDKQELFLDPTATIVANDTSARAYSGNQESRPPSALNIGTEYDSTEYDAIGADDGVYADQAGYGTSSFTYHRYNFTIPTYGTISYISSFWNGKTESSGYTGYIDLYNYTGSAWNEMNSTYFSSTSYSYNLIYNLTSNIQNYVDSNNEFNFLVEIDGLGLFSDFRADYAYITVSYTVPGTTPPTWSSFGQNATSISSSDTVQMWANISDDVALDYAWLATNESGTWINYTTTAGRYIDLSGIPTNTIVYLNWSNDSFTGTFNWKIYFNDTSGNVNSTILLPKWEIFDANEYEIEKAWEANENTYAPGYTPPRTGVSGQYDTNAYTNLMSSDDLYADDAGSSLTYPSLEIAFNTTKPLGYKFAIGNITIENEGHGRSASYAYGVWVWNFTSSSWVNLIDETGHDTDITVSISSTNPDDLISSSLGDYIAYLYTAHNWKSSTGIVYVDYIYMKVEYNASFVTVTQATDLSFSVGLPATGCTEGKGSTDADATCDRCWIEPTSWTMNNNLLSATQVGCEGQTDSVAFYNITNSGNVNLNITFALNETLDTTKFRNKMSQVSTGYESTCSGDVTTGCVYIESTTPVTVIWDLAPSNSQELWQWSDFINVALSDTKELSQNITSSQS